MSRRTELEHRTFPARCADGRPDDATAAWSAARYRGFLQPLPGDRELALVAQAWQDEGRTLHAIYDPRPRPAAALPADVPVATLATVEASLDAGGARPIPCTLVADVTVSATHRGDGLMRRLMERALADAATAGVPLVALHAAHPALYARFGFAPATSQVSVEVDCSRFALRRRPGGTVHEADARRAAELARVVASRPSAMRFGALTLASPAAVAGPQDPTTRCLVHTDEGGDVDGVLTAVYQGWTPDSSVIEVTSQTCSTVQAHAALWQAIAATGIATTARAADVRPDDPLPWMLADRAAWRVTGRSDGYSLRVLDPPQTWRLRGYAGVDGEQTIEVADQHGPAGGRWSVRVSDRVATVEAASGPADVTLDVAELAATFLGATRARPLADAGLIAAEGDAADAYDALMGGHPQPFSTLHF